jgi:hypothetical protein
LQNGFLLFEVSAGTHKVSEAVVMVDLTKFHPFFLSMCMPYMYCYFHLGESLSPKALESANENTISWLSWMDKTSG